MKWKNEWELESIRQQIIKEGWVEIIRDNTPLNSPKSFYTQIQCLYAKLKLTPFNPIQLRRTKVVGYLNPMSQKVYEIFLEEEIGKKGIRVMRNELT